MAAMLRRLLLLATRVIRLVLLLTLAHQLLRQLRYPISKVTLACSGRVLDSQLE